MRDGLVLPEGCELAARIVLAQEQHCAAWGFLQGFTDRRPGGSDDEEEEEEAAYEHGGRDEERER